MVEVACWYVLKSRMVMPSACRSMTAARPGPSSPSFITSKVGVPVSLLVIVNFRRASRTRAM